jgi:bifunctional DNase/RNase
MMKLAFETVQFEEHKISEKDLVQLYPHGVSLNQDPSRPILILRNRPEKGQAEHTLAVNLSPIETGVLIQQSAPGVQARTHRVTELLLESLKIRIEKCVFVALKDNHQYLRLYLDGHPTHGSLKVKAEEAMSLCLHLEVPIFATKKFMNKSRVMSAEVEGLSQGLMMNPAVMTKTHEYLI